ncbi:MAG: MarR family winged helix-turn-helix transcriptional regulator [Psychrobium sp.]
MTKTYQPHLKKLGLTYPQYIVMLSLWQYGVTNVKTLGERLTLDSGTLTPLLKRLEANELVSRQRSSNDERVVEVFLTSQGQALEQDALAMRQEMLCQAQGDVEALVSLKEQLQQLTADLS